VNFRPRGEHLLMFEAAMDAWVHGRIPKGTPEDMALALEAVAINALPQLPTRDVRDQVRPHLVELTEVPSLYGILPLKELARFETDVRVVAAAGRAQAIDARVTDALLRALQGAKRDVVLVSPYVLLTPAQLEAMIAASLRGVRITLITNSPISTDNLFSQSLFIDTWPELCARIPTLRVYAGADDRMMHAKIAIIDDDLTLIGTYNLDPFSAYVNSEMFVAAWSKDVNRHTRLAAANIMKPMVEYKILKDKNGEAVRHAKGPKAGQPVVLFGPKHHTPRYKMAEVRSVKPLIVATKGLWDFEVVAW
jgi:cardiolipin synthase C